MRIVCLTVWLGVTVEVTVPMLQTNSAEISDVIENQRPPSRCTLACDLVFDRRSIPRSALQLIFKFDRFRPKKIC